MSHDGSHSSQHESKDIVQTMLLLLVVLNQVVAEWVEISQQHYRKPVRMHSINNPFTSTETNIGEGTTQSWKKNNSSITNYQRNKAVLQQPNAVNLERVTFSDSDRTIPEDEDHLYLGNNGFDLQHNFEQSTEYNAKQKGIIERVPNRGNVKRVQLMNNPVKSPTINSPRKEGEIKNDRYEEFPLEEEYESHQFHGINENMETKYNNRRIYLTLNKRNPETIRNFPDLEDKSSEIKTHKERPKLHINNHTIIKDVLPSPTPTFITKTNEPTGADDQVEYTKFAQKKPSIAVEITNIDEDTVTKNSYSTQKQAMKQQQENYDQKHTKDIRNNALLKQPLSQVLPSDSIIINNYEKTKRKNNNDQSGQENATKNDNQYENDNNNKENTDKILKVDSKVNNMESLLKILKVVADTISQNSRKSLGGKMRYLHDLKNSILANIGERIESTWPDDGATPRRETRSAGASSRGHHVHFPSSESALMTISFLTFGVFLIKLVLQLIHTYKNKAMMVAPVMVASAGRASRT